MSFRQILLWVLGTAVSAVRGQVVMSEIHYHPAEEAMFNADGTPVLDLTEDVHEFLEIQNAGWEDREIGGWKVSGGVDFVVPAGTVLQPGEFKVIAKNPERIEAAYGLAAGSVLGPYSGKLGNDGDTVRLKDAEGATVEEITYSGHFPWAQSANAFGAQDRFIGLRSISYNYRGRSLQRFSVAAPANDPANWLASPLTGPSPGAAQSVTGEVPKPVVIAQSRVQSSNGSRIIRALEAVTVKVTFSATINLSEVQVEYFLDDVNSTFETRNTLPMTAAGNRIFTAELPKQADRSIVRYRFLANRGDGVEPVSPRTDDPQIAPTGPGGTLEAWHGYFVTPVRPSPTPAYDVFVGTAQYTRMGTNINASPRRITSSGPLGQPREVPFVAASAAQWNGTVPAVFACDGEIRDIHLRYHGSRYHRSVANLSFKIHFPEHQPFREVTSFFVTGHFSNTAEMQRMYRLLDLPSSLTRTVDWYFNNDPVISRLEHGEYERHVLEEWTARQQQLNPGSEREETGEFYKAIGNIDASQNNLEGPYTKGDQAPMLPNSGWTQLQRYEWTYSLQNNTWKGHTSLRNMIEGMWTARGDTPAAPTLGGNAANLASTRAWFQANFDVDATLTAVAVCQWAGIWDDTAHNQFFWRRANGKWVRLPWDFDDTMTNPRTTQSIYANEQGVNIFLGPNWWKDTFLKCFRNEFKQRLWDLNNTFLDPANLTANGLPTAAGFAGTRQANVNSQIAFGTFNKPARPFNTAPPDAAAIVGGALLSATPYSHPAGRAHAKSKWEIRLAGGDYEEPEVRVISTTDLTGFAVPFDQLTYGKAYAWRVTYYDVDGHASIVSNETTFTYGNPSAVAGTLALNEILADNRSAAENGGKHPDYIELRNNSVNPVSLSGFSLSDDPLTPAKFVFPAGTTLDPQASLIVWCDDEAAAPGLHTGFGIDASGQTVLLLNGAALVDAVTFGPQAPDISIGRIVNGTGGWQANTPTPGTANVAQTLGGPASLRINEWMASPAYGEDWFEIFNPDDNPVALSGLHLSDDPGEPVKTKIPALSFIAGKGWVKFQADGSDAGGNHAGFKLGNGGDHVVLTAADATTTLDLVSFGTQARDVSQGRLTDGGDAVVSFAGSGSPAGSNWLPAPVVINEALANSTAPLVDRVELHNPTTAAIDIGGWWLSDDRRVLQKFQIPAGTVIDAGGFAVFEESEFSAGAIPFLLSSLGDEIVLSAVDEGGILTGFRSQVNFGASAENVSFGRVPVAGGEEFWPQTAATFASANAAPKTTPLIINEIMYHPTDGAAGEDNTGEEFIEVYNPGNSAVDVSGWRVKGGSNFTFPPGGSVAARGYILVVSFDPEDTSKRAAFCTRYGLPETTSLMGPLSNRLSNATQNVELAMPGPPAGTETPYINVDKVEYRDATPWDTAADGAGFSLQRESRFVIGNDAANWSAAPPTPGAVNGGVISDLTIVSDAVVPGGVAGLACLRSFQAAGGAQPYTWSLGSGTLPGGMTLVADGSLSGMPQTAGTFTFGVQVQDGANAVETKSFSLTIAATALLITTASLPDGLPATAYSQALAASGGNPGYVWSVSAGVLPGGLSLSPAGVISGSPTGPGTFEFTVQVMDAGALSAVRSFSIHIAGAGALHHFSWSYVPAAANAGTPFAVQILAHDAQGRLVSGFNGNVSVSAVAGSGSAGSPVVLTEVINEVEDQFELQNVSPVTVDTTGWFVRLGDSTADINSMNGTTLTLPTSLAPGEVVRVSETNTAGRRWFGNSIAWNTTTPRGWLMLFDADRNLRDFFIFGWSAAEIANLSVMVNGRNVTPAGHWSGAGAAQGALGTINNNTDSWQRMGSEDGNTAADWPWMFNGSTPGQGNPGMTLPWAVAAPVGMTPAGVAMTNGEWIGYLTIGQAANSVRLNAASGAVTGMSTVFGVNEVLTDTDGDGMPDAYEAEHGLAIDVNDAAGDADGDGSSNGAEFAFGTDPQTPGVFPVITAYSVNGSGEDRMLNITWPAQAGKIYRLETSTDAVNWQGRDVLAMYNGFSTATVTGGGTGRLFARVAVGR